jgi:hypothetical protein
MHQPLTDESLILTTSSTPVLDPTLRRALGVLDARLEDELARYRRYRAGKRIAPSSVTALKRSMAAPAALRLPTPVAPAAVAPKIAPTPMVSDRPSVIATPAIADEDITLNQTPGAPPLPPRTPHSFQNNAQNVAQNAVAPLATSALVVTPPVADDTNAIGEPLITPDDLPQYGFITDNDFATDASAPNDYLESSEELLRSLAQEEATVAAERSVLEGLLTPFGVGSMLLMLLGSGMFGYLIMNPASLNAVKGLALKVASFRSNPNPTPGNLTAVEVDGGQGDSSWMANAPALDANEFLNLSLGNISALRTRPGGLTLMPSPNGLGNLPLQQLGNSPATPTNPGKAKAGPVKPGAGITSFTPLNIKPLNPPAPVIASQAESQSSGSKGGGLFSGAPVRISPPARPARSYEPAYSAPAPRYEPRDEAPAPRYKAPAPRYEAPAPRYEAPPEQVRVLPPPPAPIEQLAPAAAPQPQGDYRVVTPYTGDADLETAQKSNPNASFRNMEDGAYIQHDSYGSQAEADAKAAELRDQGIAAEVK